MVAERRARSVDHVHRKLCLRQDLDAAVKSMVLQEEEKVRNTEEPDPELPLAGAPPPAPAAVVGEGPEEILPPTSPPVEMASTEIQSEDATDAPAGATFDITSAARMFSTNEVPREFMESLGHILQRSPTPPSDGNEVPVPGVAAGHADYQGEQLEGDADPIDRPSPRPALPPPLTEIDEPLDEDDSTPGTPEWSPKHCMMPPWPVQGALQMPGTPCVMQQESMRPVPPSLQSPQSIPPTPHPGVPLLSPMQRSPAGPESQVLYRVAFRGGLDLRRGPSYGALRTGVTLRHNEIFAVSQELQGSDGRIYLHLSDGRGWAFNDAALIPHDPSVMRGHWAPMPSPMPATSPCCCPPSVSSATATGQLWDPSWEPCPASVTSAASAHWEPMAEPTTPPGGWGTIDEGDTGPKKSRRRRKRGGKKRRPKGRAAVSDLPIWAADQDEDEASEVEADEESGGADDGADLST